MSFVDTKVTKLDESYQAVSWSVTLKFDCRELNFLKIESLDILLAVIDCFLIDHIHLKAMRLEISIVRKHNRSSVTKVTLLIWKWEFHFRLVWKKRQERSEYIWKFCPSRIRIIPEIWARLLRVSAPAPGEATLVKKSPRLNYECCPALAVKHHTKLLLEEILDEENVRDEGSQLAVSGWRLCGAQLSCNQENCKPAIV